MREFGDIAVIQSAEGPLTVAYVAPNGMNASWSGHPDRFADAILLRGRCQFNGHLITPGFVGPINTEGDHIKWREPR